MNKYPVIYQGKEYEVRWERDSFLSYIRVYEVLPRKIFKYKKLNSFYTNAIHALYDLKLDDEDLYIKQAQYAVKMALEEIETDNKLKILEETRKQKLEEWDGVIE